MNKPIEVTTARLEAWASLDILRVIRAFCCECLGGHRGMVPGCESKTCPFWPFRTRITSVRKGFTEAGALLSSQGRPDLFEKMKAEKAKRSHRIDELRKSIPDPFKATTSPSAQSNEDESRTEGRG
jgi:hypothetical protein